MTEDTPSTKRSVRGALLSGRLVSLEHNRTTYDGGSGTGSVPHRLLKVVERLPKLLGEILVVASSSDTPLRQARIRRGWSFREAARELRLRAAEVGRPLPGSKGLISMISRWELGRHLPGPFYRWLFSEVYAIPEVALFGAVGDPGG